MRYTLTVTYVPENRVVLMATDLTEFCLMTALHESTLHNGAADQTVAQWGDLMAWVRRRIDQGDQFEFRSGGYLHAVTVDAMAERKDPPYCPVTDADGWRCLRVVDHIGDHRFPV